MALHVPEIRWSSVHNQLVSYHSDCVYSSSFRWGSFNCWLQPLPCCCGQKSNSKSPRNQNEHLVLSQTLYTIFLNQGSHFTALTQFHDIFRFLVNFQVFFHYLQSVISNLIEFDLNKNLTFSRFSRCTLIFPGFPGRVGTPYIPVSKTWKSWKCWSDDPLPPVTIILLPTDTHAWNDRGSGCLPSGFKSVCHFLDSK